MTLSEDNVERIVRAAETIETSLAVLSEKQSLSRSAYLTDRESRDVVERRFVKLTEATLDIAKTIVINDSSVGGRHSRHGSLRRIHRLHRLEQRSNRFCQLWFTRNTGTAGVS